MGITRVRKQIGPTCGIYGFLNGLSYNSKLDMEKIDEVAYKIYNVYKFLPGQHVIGDYNKVEKDESKKVPLTYVGEFFDIEKFCVFLQRIEVEGLNKEDINYKVSISKLKCLDKFDFKNGFVLFLLPLNEVPSNEKEGDVVHWITIVGKEKNGKFKILDSSSDSLQKCMTKNELGEATKKIKNFNWENYNRRLGKKLSFKCLDKAINYNLKSKKKFIDQLGAREVKISNDDCLMVKVEFHNDDNV